MQRKPSESADLLVTLASNLQSAAAAQVEALRCADTAALTRASNWFAALSKRWDAAATQLAHLSPAQQSAVENALHAAAAALVEAEQLGRAYRDELAQRLGEAPLQRERLLAYSRAMGLANSTKSNKT